MINKFNTLEHDWSDDLNTENEVEFLINLLKLKGSEKILDIGCGKGRHSLVFSEKGFNIIGVDNCPKLIEEAEKQALLKGLNCKFICSDILELDFYESFDVVLNLYDGAIGYFNEVNNLKLIKKINKALVLNGKHFTNILDRNYFDNKAPFKTWKVTDKHLILTEYILKNDLLTQSGHILPLNRQLVIKNKNPFTFKIYYPEEIKRYLINENFNVINLIENFSFDNKTKNQLAIYSKKIHKKGIDNE